MKVLLLQAFTDSEWDTVSFALIEMNDNLKNQLQKTIKRQLELKEEGIDKLVISADNADFFTDEEQLPEICFNELGEIQEGIYELSDELIEELTRPESYLKYGETIFSHGCVTFKTHAEYNEDEFWSSSISFDKDGSILDECENLIPELTPIL